MGRTKRTRSSLASEAAGSPSGLAVHPYCTPVLYTRVYRLVNAETGRSRLEATIFEDPGHGIQVAPVRLDVLHQAVLKVIVITPVKHGDIVAEGSHPFHGVTAHKMSAADKEDAHRSLQ